MTARPDDDPIPADVPMSAGLRALARKGELRRYRKGTLLIQEGDHGDQLYILLTGSVKAYSTDERDREITYGTLAPGDYFGEMSLDGGPRSASVITLEATRCSVVSREILREHIANDAQFAFELLERVIARVRALTDNARSLALLGVYPRLVKLLNTQAQELPDGRRALPARLTHQALANHVGASREMVSRLMKDLARGGYVAVEQHRIVLVRPLPTSW
ncbi:MAG: Crp/Fnr family transcriptional regulator [Proteobacteria bacterium]|nr:Crp/Fnr family transcriptional regulator [Pseudomonadota bacterium]